MPLFQLQQDDLFWIIPMAGLIAAILGLLTTLSSWPVFGNTRGITPRIGGNLARRSMSPSRSESWIASPQTPMRP